MKVPILWRWLTLPSRSSSSRLATSQHMLLGGTKAMSCPAEEIQDIGRQLGHFHQQSLVDLAVLCIYWNRSNPVGGRTMLDFGLSPVPWRGEERHHPVRLDL